MKTIGTGTEIIFTKTGEKFELIQTDTGFDVKPVKFSKNVPAEHYSFQDILDEYEAGRITIAGFEEGDTALVKAQILNHMYAADKKIKIDEISALKKTSEELKLEITNLKAKVQEISEANGGLVLSGEKLIKEKEQLNKKIEQLNTTIAAMDEETAA